VKYSIVIPTYNRVDELQGTLASLAGISCADSWELIVADNNCTDGTRAAVAAASMTFPVRVKYVFEAVAGRCAALNAGISEAVGDIIVTIDDDVRVQPDFLDQVGRAFATHACDFIGGRVHPLWRGERPSWLPSHPTRHWAVIALLDHGPEPFEWDPLLPLGANMAFTRHAYELTGPWNNDIGRKAGTLLGQEVREWCIRARARGLRGFYTPDVFVHHVIHADRLNKSYFRRWFYWRGVSRAIMYQQLGLDMQNPVARTYDFTRVPHIGGVPRYLLRSALANLGRLARATLKRQETQAFEYELVLWMFAGIARQRWKDRRRPFAWAKDVMHAQSVVPSA